MIPTHIILHTAGFKGDADIDEIRRWHMKRGWNDVGYHYYIRRSGKIQPGRPETIKGAHCTDMQMNSRSLGICFEGHGDHEPLTQKQRNAICNLYLEIDEKWDIPPKRVLGHRETGADKTCPGELVDMDDIRNMLTLWASVQHLPERGDDIDGIFSDFEPPDNAFERVDPMGLSSWNMDVPDEYSREIEYDNVEHIKPRETMIRKIGRAGKWVLNTVLGTGTGLGTFALTGDLTLAVAFAVGVIAVALGVEVADIKKLKEMFFTD